MCPSALIATGNSEIERLAEHEMMTTAEEEEVSDETAEEAEVGEASNGQTDTSVQGNDEDKLKDRERKLLEIKAEMEIEIKRKKESSNSISIARERRVELREMKQQLRKKDSARRKALVKKEIVVVEKPSTPVMEERKPHPSTIHKEGKQRKIYNLFTLFW